MHPGQLHQGPDNFGQGPDQDRNRGQLAPVLRIPGLIFVFDYKYCRYVFVNQHVKSKFVNLKSGFDYKNVFFLTFS